MRLIDADALNMYLSDVEYANRGWKDDFADTVAEFMAEVDERPTIDAVPVVRCKDSKHWKKGDFQSGHSIEHMEWGGGCCYAQFARYESDFCSYGERRNND